MIIYIHIYIDTCVYIHIYIGIYIYVHTSCFIHIHINIYIYIYIYTYIYNYIYIYIYTFFCVFSFCFLTALKSTQVTRHVYTRHVCRHPMRGGDFQIVSRICPRTRARHATGHSARTAAKLQVPTAAHLPISPRPDSAGAFPLCVCLLLHDLVQRWLRGGGILEDMCYERRRAKACVD